VVIHQGIPVPDFPSKPRPGTLGSPLRLLYVGQLHEYKGVHTLLEAADRVARLLGTVHVTVIGDGPEDYLARLRALAAAGRADVEFAGRLPHSDLPPVYRGHDVFVFPSIWAEPFGLTHLEAMASGTVVISTANGGQAEFLVDGENALVFPKEDAKELASRILSLAGDPGLAARLAVSGRALVERQYSIERYVTDLERFLERCLPEERG
jgi:spore coat protein SA